MSVPIIADPVPDPAPFIGLMFDYLWRRRPSRPTTRDLSGASIQSTLLMLKKLTGLSHEDMAKRLLITVYQLNNIEARGKPMRSEYAERMAIVAGDYGLTALYEHFYYRAAALKRAARSSKAPRSMDEVR